MINRIGIFANKIESNMTLKLLKNNRFLGQNISRISDSLDCREVQIFSVIFIFIRLKLNKSETVFLKFSEKMKSTS